MTPRLTVIHLARKPLVGTVAQNALKYGTGSLNIDATRIGTSENLSGGAYAQSPQDRPTYQDWRFKRGDKGNIGEFKQPSGRWPANVIIQHLDGCSLTGTHEDFLLLEHTEVIEEWECQPGCPVLDLDQQSGTKLTGGGGNRSQGNEHGGVAYGKYYTVPTHARNDIGGASRYFKQVQGDDALWHYLKDLISTPVFQPLFWKTFYDLTDWNSGTSLPGLVTNVVPTEQQAKELLRVCVPGAHIALIAPDEQPTGHTGAIRLEDAGFEIRDSILWVRGDGRTHYVGKAQRKEREAGCGNLPPLEGTSIRNFHNTVKPVRLMQRLLEGVEGPVLDPFMGSGTTGIACLQTGHDFTGIEKEPAYLAIADARIRHWDNLVPGACSELISEHAPESSTKPVSLFDLIFDD